MKRGTRNVHIEQDTTARGALIIICKFLSLAQGMRVSQTMDCDRIEAWIGNWDDALRRHRLANPPSAPVTLLVVETNFSSRKLRSATVSRTGTAKT